MACGTECCAAIGMSNVVCSACGPAIAGAARTMTTSKLRRPAFLLSAILCLGLVVTCVAAAFGQDKWKEAAARGPFRAVLSRPLPSVGWRAGELYADLDVVSAFCNQLDRDGLVPVHTEVLLEHDAEGRAGANRILVIARRR